MGSRADGYEVVRSHDRPGREVGQQLPEHDGGVPHGQRRDDVTQNVPAAAPGKIHSPSSTARPNQPRDHLPRFSYVRMPRPTRNKTFLVPCDMTLFEGDANGSVLWTARWPRMGAHLGALLMANGDVLLGTFFGSSLDVVDPHHPHGHEALRDEDDADGGDVQAQRLHRVSRSFPTATSSPPTGRPAAPPTAPSASRSSSSTPRATSSGSTSRTHGLLVDPGRHGPRRNGSGDLHVQEISARQHLASRSSRRRSWSSMTSRWTSR